MNRLPHPATATIIGGGPAGLMAAEILSAAGVTVDLYDRMATLGRKFLMAGRGGLNLTHSEPLEVFLGRYGMAQAALAPAIEAFPPAALRAWAAGLDQETFVGPSGRVFPVALKASPLLRAWLNRLQRQSVRFHPQHDWLGWTESGALHFRRRDGIVEQVTSDATLLALGGASWPKLGADGGWVSLLRGRDVPVTPLRPANCGFKLAWSEIFRDRFQGQPLKNIALSFAGHSVRGEAMVTAYGLEGGAIYALSASLRDAIAADGAASLLIDFCPDRSVADVETQLGKPRRAQSHSSFLRRVLGLSPVAINLLREASGPSLPTDSAAMAALIKAAPLRLIAPQPLDRAISTAGGIALSALDKAFMLTALPGLFAAGEMLDWEAPTGGYLLQAVFASGRAAAHGMLAWLAARQGCGSPD